MVKRPVITKSFHPGTTLAATCAEAPFPIWKAKVSTALVQSSVCPLWGSATRWWHYHKSHLPLTRGQWYMPKLNTTNPSCISSCTMRTMRTCSHASGLVVIHKQHFKWRHTPIKEYDLFQTHFSCDQLPWMVQESNNCYASHYCFKDLFYWCAIGVFLRERFGWDACSLHFSRWRMWKIHVY